MPDSDESVRRVPTFYEDLFVKSTTTMASGGNSWALMCACGVDVGVGADVNLTHRAELYTFAGVVGARAELAPIGHRLADGVGATSLASGQVGSFETQ